MRDFHSYCLSIVLLALVGCASGVNRDRILNVPLVSMTHSMLPAGYQLMMGQRFVSEFCENETPIVRTGKIIGLADQALYKAQKNTKATHLLDVVVTKEEGCAIAEGNAAVARKVAAGTGKASARNAASVTDVMPADSETQEIWKQISE